MNNKIALVAGLLVLAIFLFGCTQPSAPSTGSTGTTTVPNTGTTTNTNPNGPDYFPNGAPGTQGDQNAGITAPEPVSINIQNFSFSPATITVPVGTTITWTNNDSMAHTVTENNGVFNSGDLAQGQTFSYTFDTTGTYNYHCNIHPSMKATVIVQ